MNLIYASDEENIPSSVFIIQAEETKAVIQWERFGNFNRLVNTVACVHRALNKQKPATLVVSIEEREKAKATIFKLLQQKQFGEEMKCLNAEKEIPKGSEILQFSTFLDEEGLFRAKAEKGKVSWTSMQNITYWYIGNIMRLIVLVKPAPGQLT